jgi:hypothetical protein
LEQCKASQTSTTTTVIVKSLKKRALLGFPVTKKTIVFSLGNINELLAFLKIRENKAKLHKQGHQY